LAIDLDFIRWLGKNEIPFALCFTKSDKLSVSEQQKNFSYYKEILLSEWEFLPPVFFTSIFQNKGRDDILTFIEKTNKKIYHENSLH
jgi:GTP-binding protein